MITRQDARIILSGLLHDDMDVRKLTASARSEIRAAAERVLALCQHKRCVCQDAGMVDPEACDFVGKCVLKKDQA